MLFLRQNSPDPSLKNPLQDENTLHIILYTTMQCAQPSTSRNENIPSAGLAKGRQVSLHTPAFVGTHRWVLCAIDALAVSRLPVSLSCNHIQSSDSINFRNNTIS